MELGLHFIDFLPGDPARLGSTLADAAKAAEQGGATLFTLADHFFQMEELGPAQNPFLEGYTSLGFLAAQTSTIDLALLVTGVTYRHPGVLAKTVTTLDVLSQGRSMLGLGAAWYEREHTALGIPYPPLSARFEMLEETLQICRQMWSDDDGPYAGKHYRLNETICAPQPIRRPPILIGGDGERKTLRLVAQYADIWNSMSNDVDELAHKVDVLRGHCDAVGRDSGDIRKTSGGLATTDPFENIDEYLKTAERFAALGVDMINVGPLPGNPDPVGFVRRLGDEVIPRLAEIG
ncbi:LLM class F420-dependent oxidoreductase [Mycobacterium marseillense]|uniref:LLM class F420-dependent oxidoreductase n=1 Tax=Mycobacterium marseillense TaxID=701042 RepID=A0ABM7JEC3_9MYCO|nr:LLM class F420-dependent oxidoreductase [Mycobacterium marseillense]MCV7403943.1 LLM class F420-dependent oxidoreductase [Mycobacterium marseillense]ORA89157.1 LLM class F420-dependent oxidoreductase [Mycobacterium marseillense]BBY12280.1 LLM class F420-dependent oxidoreductase [Mycobacterium marseillense]